MKTIVYNVLVITAYLNVVSRFQLTVFHMIFLELHERSVWICLAHAAAVLTYLGFLLLVSVKC